ncbi:hypothetical protein [Microbacterium gallinarum]|uniref:ScyD/ScyE family protein n=1 Tax=Microbacterium gallinarum TaxID=2762209 RepID=A0ABR8X0P8_9MICO|nr:hypothetical protein [Microbacterium gallinarum]MBD8022416.1 hypothetical protein [Microbacterium gallinarum]
MTGAVVTALAVASLLGFATGGPAVAGEGGKPGGKPVASLLASGLQGASGSTIGPDGALYVTEGMIGQVTRIDPRTGAKTPFATCLPPAILPLGGAIDVAFIGETAYVLVTLVGEGVPGGTADDIAGIYRVDGPHSFTAIADLGSWTVENPPPPEIDVFVAGRPDQHRQARQGVRARRLVRAGERIPRPPALAGRGSARARRPATPDSVRG